MEQTLKQTILEFLDIVGYEGDKEAYAMKFQEMVSEKTLSILIKGLGDKENEFKEKVKLEIDPNKKAQVINATFTEEQAKQATQQALSEAFAKVVKDVAPTLDQAKLRQLEEFLNRLKQPS